MFLPFTKAHFLLGLLSTSLLLAPIPFLNIPSISHSPPTCPSPASAAAASPPANPPDREGFCNMDCPLLPASFLFTTTFGGIIFVVFICTCWCCGCCCGRRSRRRPIHITRRTRKVTEVVTIQRRLVQANDPGISTAMAATIIIGTLLVLTPSAKADCRCEQRTIKCNDDIKGIPICAGATGLELGSNADISCRQLATLFPVVAFVQLGAKTQCANFDGCTTNAVIRDPSGMPCPRVDSILDESTNDGDDDNDGGLVAGVTISCTFSGIILTFGLVLWRRRRRQAITTRYNIDMALFNTIPRQPPNRPPPRRPPPPLHRLTPPGATITTDRRDPRIAMTTDRRDPAAAFTSGPPNEHDYCLPKSNNTDGASTSTFDEIGDGARPEPFAPSAPPLPEVQLLILEETRTLTRTTQHDEIVQ